MDLLHPLERDRRIKLNYSLDLFNFCTHFDQEWWNTVQEMSDLVSVIVVDLRRESDAFSREVAWLIKSPLLPKCVFMVHAKQSTSRLDTYLIQNEKPNLKIVTEEDLIPAVKNIFDIS